MSETKEQSWLQARSKGIGGSEITAVMGLDPYRTPYTLWEIKTGRVAGFEGNKYTMMGNYLEPVVADIFQNETGLECYTKKQEHFSHPDYPHLLGTPDRFVKLKGGGEGVLEIKTTQKRISREDINEGGALNWYFQLQWYMGITGKKTGFLAWLCSGVDFDYVQVDFNAEIFSDMVEAGDRFWRENVLADIAPPPINKEDIMKVIGMVLPDAIELPEDALQYHAALKENKAKIKELENANDELATAVQLLMMDKSIGTYQGARLFTWNESNPTRLDSKLLKEEMPEVWEKYSKTSQQRTFLVK